MRCSPPAIPRARPRPATAQTHGCAPYRGGPEVRGSWCSSPKALLPKAFLSPGLRSAQQQWPQKAQRFGVAWNRCRPAGIEHGVGWRSVHGTCNTTLTCCPTPEHEYGVALGARGGWGWWPGPALVCDAPPPPQSADRTAPSGVLTDSPLGAMVPQEMNPHLRSESPLKKPIPRQGVEFTPHPHVHAQNAHDLA